MTCRPTTRPFNRAHVGVAWMLVAGIVTAAALLLLAGCAIEPNGTISPFEGLDHGCQIEPQSCK
jgi:hypothetical protein